MPFFGGGGGDYHIVETNIKGGTDAAPAIIGTNNMALGNGALQNADNADYNIAIGNLAGTNIQFGFNNTLLGYSAGAGLTDGLNNTFIGYSAGTDNQVGEFNVLVGNGAGSGALLNNPFNATTLIGANAGENISDTIATTHNNTTAIGSGALYSEATSGIDADFTDTIAIGAECASSYAVSLGDMSNSIFIGTNLVPLGPNTIQIGDVSHTSIVIGGLDFTNIGSGIFGDPGTEGTGIDVNGVTYDSALKVSDIGAGNIAQFIVHRHSTTIEPIHAFARSNSDTSAHADVTNGMALATTYFTGWTGGVGGNYKIFGGIRAEVSATGTVGATSAPGELVFYVTEDGNVAVTEAIRITSRASLQAGVIESYPGRPLSLYGAGSLDASGDNISIIGGDGALDTINIGDGGSVSILAGFSAGSAGNGGNITITPGGSLNGTTGTITLYDSATNVAIQIADGPAIGFNAAAPIPKPTITGSRGGNAALASLLTELANYGLIIDGTTA